MSCECNVKLVFLSFLERDARYKKWKMAVERSLGWATIKMSDQMTGKFKIAEQAKSEMPGVIEAALFKYSSQSA